MVFGIKVSNNGTLKEIENMTPVHIHDVVNDVYIASESISITNLCLDATLAHKFCFPPPFNRFCVPNDMFFFKYDNLICKEDVYALTTRNLNKKCVVIPTLYTTSENNEEIQEEDIYSEEEEEEEEELGEEEDDEWIEEDCVEDNKKTCDQVK